jgi:hypothetical protein
MTGDGFLKRWSRRKRADENAPPAAAVEAAVAPAPPVASPNVPAAPAAEPAPIEPPIDPATLPPVESLGAGSDYTVFLRRGVPEALRRAALRRAWETDPVIRDFRTPADYDWDFNAPEWSTPLSAEESRALLDKILPSAEPAPAAPAAAPATAMPAPPAAQPPTAQPPAAPVMAAAEPAAPPPPESTAPRPLPLPPAPAAESPLPSTPVPQESTPSRRHGGALPR